MPDPQQIGKYTILQRIGRGGMGYVYRAHDPILKRDVAIKTMLRDVSEDPELRSRFMREAQSAGGLRHPNIVTIYDLGEEEGIPYIAMEFLTGTDLEQIIRDKTELSLDKKIDIIIQTCQGLGYAHSSGIVHRDIKTANIRILDNGEVKIMDFGIAKVASAHFTRTGMIMGTPHYMAPEQIRGEKIDGRADIFSLGVVLYELLTYRKPFPGDNPTTVLFKIIHEMPDPLVDDKFTPPAGLEDIVLRAIAKKPDERYQTCEELAQDLLTIYGMLEQNASATDTPIPAARRLTATPKSGLRTGPRVSQTGTPLPGQMGSSPPQTPPPIAAPGSEPTKQSTARPVAATLPMGEGPTVLSPEVPVTELQPETPLPPLIPTLPPAPIQKAWIVLASIGSLVLVVLVAIAIYTWKKPQPEPISHPIVPAVVPHQNPPVNPPAVTTGPVGWVELNIQPWAQVSRVVDAKGKDVHPPTGITPCRIALPAGAYEITLSNKQYKTLVLKLEVAENQTTTIHQKLEGFDYAKAVDSLGL